MTASEINPRVNESVRRFFNFNREYILILLAAICVIITIGTHIRMNAVVDSMADIKAGYEVNIREMVKSNTDVQKQVDYLKSKSDRLEAKLSVVTGEH